MSSDEQKLYDPHVTTQMSTYPPSEPAPQYQPAPQTFHGTGYQPVSTQQSSSNTTVAVVNSAPTMSTFTTVAECPPSNFIVLNVLTLLCCCFLFGLIGLLYSVQVDSQWARGDHQGALSSSRTAKSWGIAGIVTGSCLIGGTVLLNVIIFIAAAASSSSSSNDD